MFSPLEIVGDTVRGSTDHKVRGSNLLECQECPLVGEINLLELALFRS
jgi:hypothetical protein